MINIQKMQHHQQYPLNHQPHLRNPIPCCEMRATRLHPLTTTSTAPLSALLASRNPWKYYVAHKLTMGGKFKYRHRGKSSQTLPKNLARILPSARSRSTATTERTRDFTAPLLLNKRVRGVVDGGNGLMHLRPRVSTYSAVTENPHSYRHQHFMPYFKALSGKKEPAKHTPKLAAPKIPRMRQETRLCVVGETNGEHAPIPSSTKKYINSSKTSRLCCLISKTK
jgi:hypothetical protein